MWHIYFSIGFNLAIIINNDNEDLEGQQQKKTGKDDKVPIPPAIVIGEQSEVIQNKLEGLGFGVLYFSNLTKESIHQLLEAFAQAHHDDLTSFTLVVLSKGSEPLFMMLMDRLFHLRRYLSIFLKVKSPKYQNRFSFIWHTLTLQMR